MHCIACLLNVGITMVIYGVFFIIWGPTGYVLKVKNKKNWFLLSIPIFLVMLIAFFLYQYRSVATYERAFGFPPSSDVIILEKREWYFADTGVTYLKFKANENTINQIINRGLTQIKDTKYVCDFTTNHPEWWQPDNNQNTLIYTRPYNEANIQEQDFFSEDECLYYNTKTQEAYYVFIGID